MRRIAFALGVSLSLLGCGQAGEQVPLEQVPLVTVENQSCCWLSSSIVDVVADPVSGVPIDKATGRPLRWQTGYTAWRVGAEVEVRDPGGMAVLRTPGRYWIMPTQPDWVVGEVWPCPAGGAIVHGFTSDCELGGGPL